MAETLKDRFDEAFYGLLNAGDRLFTVSEKLETAKKQIIKNKVKQRMIEKLLKENNNGN